MAHPTRRAVDTGSLRRCLAIHQGSRSAIHRQQPGRRGETCGRTVDRCESPPHRAALIGPNAVRLAGCRFALNKNPAIASMAAYRKPESGVKTAALLATIAAVSGKFTMRATRTAAMRPLLQFLNRLDSAHDLCLPLLARLHPDVGSKRSREFRIGHTKQNSLGFRSRERCGSRCRARAVRNKRWGGRQCSGGLSASLWSRVLACCSIARWQLQRRRIGTSATPCMTFRLLRT